jgi:hypothetical protein
MRRKGNLLLFSVLEEGGYSPQAALLMLDCAAWPRTATITLVMTKMVMSDSDSDEEEDGDERSPMTALISGSNGLDPEYMCLSSC